MKVAQCWDDSVLNDLKVMELCRKYGARATFNLNPGLLDRTSRKLGWVYRGFEVRRFSQAELTDVYEGFQVANHTMTHPDPTKITPEEFRREVMDCRHFLEDAFQREIRGFAWPYGAYNDACLAIARECGLAYGRTTLNTDRVLPVADPLALHSSCHFQNPDFDRIRERARESGVFYFWGHSYEMMDDPALFAAYERQLATLAEDPEVEWVDVIDLVR